MEDNIAIKKDKLCFEAQQLEMQGLNEEAIEKYEAAYQLGEKEAGYKIAHRYLWIAMVLNKNEKYATLAYHWFEKIFPYNDRQVIDSLTMLWKRYANDNLGGVILQFLIDLSKKGNNYARHQLEYIQENINDK